MILYRRRRWPTKLFNGFFGGKTCDFILPVLSLDIWMHMNQRAINKNTLVFRNNNSSTSLHQSGVIRQEKKLSFIFLLKSYWTWKATYWQLPHITISCLAYVNKAFFCSLRKINQPINLTQYLFLFFCISYSLILIDYILLWQPSNFECISYSISIFI